MIFCIDFLLHNIESPSLSESDEFIKLNFEKYSKDKWDSLAKKYNISALIVPENWNIILSFLTKNNKFAFYIF